MLRQWWMLGIFFRFMGCKLVINLPWGRKVLWTDKEKYLDIFGTSCDYTNNKKNGILNKIYY